MVGLALLAAPGCYTTSNVVSLPPLETAYPVSASSSYVSSEGTIVEKDGYRALPSFAFEKAVQSPRHAETSTVLRLEPDLDRLVKASGGDAITNLRIEPIDYDSGSHDSAARTNHTGWVFAIGGLGALSVGGLAAAHSDGDNARMGLAIGGAFAGAGAVCFVVAALMRQPATWRYWVTGRIVKEKRRSPRRARRPERDLARRAPSR
jgi:hypothetical protein